MAQEVQVAKFCDACETDLEGWGYDPDVEKVELHLSNGDTERFNRSLQPEKDQ